MNVEFPTSADVRFNFGEHGVTWELLAPFVVIVNSHTDSQRIIRVPSGFVTDFASVPRTPLLFMAYGNRAHLPAIVHDWLYSQGGMEADRLYADEVFLHGMLGTGDPPEHDARAMYDGVRTFGAKHFKFGEPTL